MAKGTVKWFNNDLGFGFINHEDGDEDVFILRDMAQFKADRTFIIGETLEFDIQQSNQGPCAINVKRVEQTGSA